MESSASFDSERILQGPAQSKPKGKRKGTDAGSNHAVAKDNGDEATSGGSDHGDDGPGADNHTRRTPSRSQPPREQRPRWHRNGPTCMSVCGTLNGPVRGAETNRSSRSKQRKGDGFKKLQKSKSDNTIPRRASVLIKYNKRVWSGAFSDEHIPTRMLTYLYV